MARLPRLFCLGLIVVSGLTTLSLNLAGCESPVSAQTVETSADRSSTTEMAQDITTDKSPTTSSSTVATSSADSAGLFDSSIVHEIVVSFTEADYEAMIQTYKDSGEKDWIEATVTIDGVTYQRVGMRLKGNSSLRGLANGRGVGTSGEISAEDPQGLPWLICLNKNIDGQNHGGLVSLVVRSNRSATALNEAVSLELLQMAGLASQRSVAVRFSVNESQAVLRLAIENPDETWMAEHFGSGGALYKAESGGDYSYRGSNPSSYDEVFDQEAGKDNTDLTPLIEFLDFINNSNDEVFSTELSSHLDVELFATYLAMEDLIGNFDDIDGPGNNSYLYYDPKTGVFTVVPWDHNLAFGAMDRGEKTPGPGRVAGEGAAARQGKNRSNILVERFRTDIEFEALYQQKLAHLRETLYKSGVAADVLAEWVTLLETQASDLVDSSTVEEEAAKIAAYFSAK